MTILMKMCFAVVVVVACLCVNREVQRWIEPLSFYTSRGFGVCTDYFYSFIWPFKTPPCTQIDHHLIFMVAFKIITFNKWKINVYISKCKVETRFLVEACVSVRHYAPVKNFPLLFLPSFLSSFKLHGFSRSNCSILLQFLLFCKKVTSKHFIITKTQLESRGAFHSTLKNSGLKFRKRNTLVRWHRPGPSHCEFVYCSCKQKAKERY